MAGDTIDYPVSVISALKTQFDAVKYDATLLLQAQLESIRDLTDGKVMLVDATNPAVMLLEFNAIENANNIQESVGLLRKAYPELAEDPDDLYRHMSDQDYIDRFASPSKTKLIFAMQYDDLFNKLVYDPTEDTYKATISRDSKFLVDNTYFTLNYPITIRRYPTGAIQISYDTSIHSPVQEVSEIVISPTIKTSTDSTRWLFFPIEVVQLNYESYVSPLDTVYNFVKNFVFTDNFYYARAWYRSTDTANAWQEIKTTHTDQVFNSQTPTVLLKVLDQELEVKIPLIYFTNGILSGELRLDVYTTKGSLSMNLQNYEMGQFGATLTPIDEERDYNSYVDAFSSISYYVYGLETTQGGSSALSFDSLRERVIYNATGPLVIPITNTQIETSLDKKGFDLVKGADVTTNRLLLATKKLPTPSAAKLVTAANIGMITFTTTLLDIATLPNVLENQERYTVKSNSVFIRENGRLRMMNENELVNLHSLSQGSFVTRVNQYSYLYSPFYYVFDLSGDTFEARAYSLDIATAKDLTFISQNQTLQMFVNTNTYRFIKTDTGYRLLVETISGDIYKNNEDSFFGMQLCFNPKNETAFAYINATMVGKTVSGERIYQFDIDTNHDFDKDNLICLTNSTVQGISNYKAWVDLETTFTLIYHTSLSSVNFVPDETDAMLGKFMLPNGHVGGSREEVNLIFGHALNNLWRRSHSYFRDKVYQTYEEDIAATYDVDTYEKGPDGSIFTIVAGNIVYNTLHLAGSNILDENGDIVYLHRQGDVVLDDNLNPVLAATSLIGREIDLLLIDARYLFATDAAVVNYRTEIEKTLVGWISDELPVVQNHTLDQSELYFFPKTTLGTIQGYITNSEVVDIDSEQSFAVELYVREDIYNNQTLRNDIERITKTVLDKYIAEVEVNMTTINEALKSSYGSSVKAFAVTGLGGDKQYKIVTMKDGRYRMSLKKRLSIQADRSLIIEDDVTFDWKKL